MSKLQGIPKTENLTEPENRNGKSTTNRDTSKAICYIQRISEKIVYNRKTILKLIFAEVYETEENRDRSKVKLM